MAKTALESPPVQNSAKTYKHTVRLAHPEEMPGVIMQMEKAGWELGPIVMCAFSNEHAAYFRRLN